MDLKISELAESVKNQQESLANITKSQNQNRRNFRKKRQGYRTVKNVTHANKSEISVGTVRLIKDKKMFNQNKMAIKPPPNNQLI
jgi:predicted  nucleic acid-binding Zn-ribbon protein